MSFSTVNLKLPVPCLRGFFGDRLQTFTTQVRPKDVYNLLGHDPRSKNWKRLHPDIRGVYEFLQRKTTKNRREGISGYIEERFGEDCLTIGAFPSLSIAFQNALEFQPNSDSPNGPMGHVMVDLAPDTVRILIDGLGRVTGALDLIDEGKGELLERFAFPVTIYAPTQGQKPLAWKEMGQLFHDMNFRVQPVTRSHAIALDTSDLYIVLASKLGERPFISDNGGVAERAASLGKKSTELVVQQVLVRTVRGACEGRAFQESNLATAENPNLTRATFNEALGSIENFFTAFAAAMGDRFTDRDSLHLTSPGWQALGVIHHDAKYRLGMDDKGVAQVAELAARIDWSRYNVDWIPLLGKPEADKLTGEEIVDGSGRRRVSITGGGRYNVQVLIDYIRERTGLRQRLLSPELTRSEVA